MPSGQPKALVPQDLQGLRGQNIQLIQQLLGFSQGGLGQNPFRGGPGAAGWNKLLSQQAPQGPVGGGDVAGRLNAFFGGLGSPQSALQRQGADALGTMLNQPTPEQRALDISLPQLQAMLTGQGPQFEQDLSLANQQGGRFGSANAILRGEAFRNLFNMRNQVAQTLGLLSQGAGQANRGLAGQAFGVGQQQAQQGDLETQRRIQILMQLLGAGQQAAFNVPTQAGGGGLGPLLGSGLGLLLGGPFGAAAGNWLGGKVFGSGGSGDGPIQSGSGAGP